MFRIITTLLVSAIFLLPAKASDMIVSDLSSRPPIQTNNQYFVSMKCTVGDRSIDQVAFDKQMHNYLRRLNKNGVFIPNRYNLGRGILEVFHGVVLSNKKPTISASTFKKGKFDFGSDSIFIPLFYGKRSKIGAGVFSSTLESAKRWRDACPNRIFVTNPENYFITPVFVYSNISENGTLFSTFLKLAFEIVADAKDVVFRKPLKDEKIERLNNIQAFVEKLETAFVGPSAEIDIGEPRRLRVGNFKIKTSLSDMRIHTSKLDSYLLGPENVPFSTRGQVLFGSPKAGTDVSTIKKTIKACNTYNSELGRAGKGLVSSEDRSFLLYRWALETTQSKEKIIACLRGGIERLDKVARRPSIFRQVVKFLAPSERAEWEITDEQMSAFEYNYSSELPSKKVTRKVNEKVKKKLLSKLAQLVTLGMGQVRAKSKFKEMPPSVQRIVSNTFTSEISLEDNTLSLDFLSSNQLPTRGTPFSILKGLTSAGYERVGCIVSAKTFEKSEIKLITYMQESLFTFSMFKQKLGKIEKLDPQKAIIVRPKFQWDGDRYRISALKIGNAYVNEILNVSICKPKLKILDGPKV